MSISPFKDLPIVTDEVWDPNSIGKSAIQNEILGDLDNPNWDRYKKAHLVFDSDNQTIKSGFKLIIARMYDGKLKVNLKQLSAAVAAINGARGGINISKSEKRAAYNHAMRYYKKADIPKKERPEFIGSSNSDNILLGKSVQLSLESLDIDECSSVAKWVQVAKEGDYLGYDRGNSPFSFTKIHFEDMIRNIRSHPSYKAGLDGYGTTNLISWDFNHSSEMPPSSGDLPITGSPAQGWTRDLRMDIDEDGKVKLMALTMFLEPALTYIREGRYQAASVAVEFNAIHPETGENIGAFLSTIALTNTPFIEGMERLAAQRNRPSASVLESTNTAGKSVENEPAEGEDKEMELIKLLSKKLDVREEDEAVLSAIEKITNESAESKKTLENLLSALGASDYAQATEKLVTLAEKGAELDKIIPELESLRKSVAEHEELKIKEDVEAVMSTRGYGEDLKEGLILYRTHKPNEFAEKYNKDAETAKHSLLTKTIAANEKGEQKSINPEELGEALVPGVKSTIDLAEYPGVNTTDRAISCIKATRETKEWNYDQVFLAAIALKKREDVTDSTTQAN